MPGMQETLQGSKCRAGTPCFCPARHDAAQLCYYTLTGGKIEVAATITPYDGEWIDGKQEYKAFLVELNPDTIDSGGSASIGKQVLPYLRLRGKMYDAEQESLCPRPITSEDGFQYSFYHLRPGATEPDPELDELLTADSVFTYPDDKYHSQIASASWTRAR